MANEQNLRPIKTLSSEEAKRRGHNGAIKANAKRKTIKSFKEACKLFCEITAPEQVREQVIKHFPDMQDKEINGFTAMVFAQKAKALKGDLGAVTFIRDTAGEKPVDKSEVEVKELTEERRSKIRNILVKTYGRK